MRKVCSYSKKKNYFLAVCFKRKQKYIRDKRIKQVVMVSDFSSSDGEISYPGIQFRLPCTPPPPGQFFMGAKLFIWTPWMENEGVLKKILAWAM